MEGYREVYLPVIKMMHEGLQVEIEPYFKEHEPEMGYVIDAVRFNLKVKLSKHRDFYSYRHKILIENKQKMSEYHRAWIIDKYLNDKNYNDYEAVFKENAIRILNRTSKADMRRNSRFHLF